MRLLTFVYTNATWLWQALLMLGVFCYSFYDAFVQHLATGMWYAVARGCGQLLRQVLLVSLLVPLCRVGYTVLQNRVHIFALYRRRTDHIIYGSLVILASLVHVLAHVMHNPGVLQTDAARSGTWMLGASIFVLAGSYATHRFTPLWSYTRHFFRPHQVGAVIFLVGYAFHVSVWQTAIVLALFLADKLFEGYARTFKTTVESTSPGKNIFQLTLKLPKDFPVSLPGQYCLLSFPAIEDRWECLHPFTIVSRDANTLVFFIQRRGDWTTKFKELLDKNQACSNLPVVVKGPFGKGLQSNDKLTYICAGIGMTPIVALQPQGEVHVIQKTSEEMDLYKERQQQAPKLERLYLSQEEPPEGWLRKTDLKLESIVVDAEDGVYACVPKPMEREIWRMCLKHGKVFFTETC